MGIVWVLGAGFSKSLGGPLLPALLSRRSSERIRAVYPDAQEVNDGWGVQTVRQMLSLHGWERTPSQPAWMDAEEFLEQLDAAALFPDSAARRLVRMRAERELDGTQFEDLAAAAKRIVAAECCLFLKEADVDCERWRPYVNWAGSLHASDTIVTFNYDRVVEMAAQAAKVGLDIVAGGQPIRKGFPRLLKMHGSVDWQATSTGEVLLVEDVEHAVRCPSGQLGIASPGPSKLAFSQRWTASGRARRPRSARPTRLSSPAIGFPLLTRSLENVCSARS